MERFLTYSLTHSRPIRLIFQTEDGKMRQVSATVTRMDGEAVEIELLRPKRTLTLFPAQILAADYRKGDEGQD